MANGYIERHIKEGQRFLANSNGVQALWVVTRSVKTETVRKIWCRVVEGAEKEMSYTRKQFGFLLRRGIVKLIGSEA